MPVVVDAAVPPGKIEVRDGQRVVATIVGFGDATAAEIGEQELKR